MRSLRDSFYHLTAPWFLWFNWLGFVAWFWNQQHEALMRGGFVWDPLNFLTICFFAWIPVNLLAVVHRRMLPPVPVIRQRQAKRAKPVKSCLVRIAVPKQWRATSPGEARMRRRLSPRLQGLLSR